MSKSTTEKLAAADADRVYGKAETHDTVVSFAAATGLPLEFVRKHGITSYNSATGVLLHKLAEVTK